jgi:hypothetical protein
MVPVMRRTIATLALLGGLAAGLGCQHIAGKSDCGWHPSDYPIAGPTAPYPIFAPSAVTPKTEIPKTKNGGGSDTDPKKMMESGF